ncbi:MAG: hypothetical protein ACKOYM_08405, partial [Actinomycetes bacterium]
DVETPLEKSVTIRNAAVDVKAVVAAAASRTPPAALAEERLAVVSGVVVAERRVPQPPCGSGEATTAFSTVWSVAEFAVET